MIEPILYLPYSYRVLLESIFEVSAQKQHVSLVSTSNIIAFFTSFVKRTGTLRPLFPRISTISNLNEI